MTTDRRAVFALIGADGMGNPAPAPYDTEFFADALAAPTGDATPRITLPDVPVPPATRQAVVAAQRRAMAPAPQGPPIPGHRAGALAAVDRGGVAPVGMPPPLGTPQPEWGASYPPVTAPQTRAEALPVRQAARPAPRQVRTPQRAANPRVPARPAARPAARQPARPAARPAKKGSAGGAVFTILFVIVLVLISSGAGREILDVIMDFLDQ